MVLNYFAAIQQNVQFWLALFLRSTIVLIFPLVLRML